MVGAKNLGLVQTWRPPTPAPVETPKSFRIEEACGEQVNSRRRSAHGTSFTASRSDRFGEIGVGERTDAWRLRDATTLPVTPQALHRLGQEEVARLHTALEGVKEQLDQPGDLADLFELLNTALLAVE